MWYSRQVQVSILSFYHTRYGTTCIVGGERIVLVPQRQNAANSDLIFGIPKTVQSQFKVILHLILAPATSPGRHWPCRRRYAEPS